MTARVVELHVSRSQVTFDIIPRASLRKKEYWPVTKATVPWFHQEHGLNERGYVPGIQFGEEGCMPKIIASEEDCLRRWGMKTNGGFEFTRRGWSESPWMSHRIEKIYRATHQRPLPPTGLRG
ncbi:hypothetical protein KC19_VG129000 [Ceratodon purpureus]|uniref:Uncharacterized protein n=1 Tax=Ceratodon purpureus TaxID=3225 RepID=A0A8T0HPH8_CERPU|nr:hypothetical protein KC19_VG129000 [Ceratodon purpureus]